MHRVFDAGEVQRENNRARLRKIQTRVLHEVPGCAVSADQLYRESDLVIDFSEDVPALADEEVLRIKQTFEKEGAVAKISSIHVNGWSGAYDKLTMSREFAAESLNLNVDKDREKIVFCGIAQMTVRCLSFSQIRAALQPCMNLMVKRNTIPLT